MQTRRALLAGAGTATVAGLAGCLGLGGGGSAAPQDADPHDGLIANAPVPDDPGSHTYARMGTGADRVVTYVGNWKCPVCAEFSTGSDRVLPLSTIVTDYVEPGDIDLRYRALCYKSNGDPFLGPDAPRAGRAGLAVWNVDPSTYWTYHEYVMQHQPRESKEWATRSTLVDFAEGAGVSDPEAVGSAVGNGQYEEPVKTTAAAAADAGVSGTPTLILGDRQVSPFAEGGDRARAALDDLTAGGGGN